MTASPFPTARRRAHAATLCLCAGAMIAWGLACGGPEKPQPDAGWPGGALLSARTQDLRPLLMELEALRATPLARSARRLREALPDCEIVEAVAERPNGWIESLRCADSPSSLAGLHAHRAGAAVAMALPLAGPSLPRVLLRADRDAQSLRLDVRWPHSDGKLASLLPGKAPPGPSVLDPGERLLHARVRVAGSLDLAALIPAGGQADALLHLRADVLGAAVLDGTWEAAIYTPLADAGMPRVAIALGVRQRAAAVAAARRLARDVEQRWSVSRSPLDSERYTGECLLDLKVLPELAPCYAATEQALVFAWNPASLRRALALDGQALTTHSDSVSGQAAGHLEIDLARLRRTDLRLAQRVGPEAVDSVARWPWRRLVATGNRRDGAIAFRVALESDRAELER